MNEIYVVAELLKDLGLNKMAETLLKTQDYSLLQAHVKLVLLRTDEDNMCQTEEILWANGLLYG